MSVNAELTEVIRYALMKRLDATQATILTQIVIQEIQNQFGGQQIYITHHLEKIGIRNEKMREAHRRAMAQIQKDFGVSYHTLNRVVRGRGAKADPNHQDLFDTAIPAQAGIHNQKR